MRKRRATTRASNSGRRRPRWLLVTILALPGCPGFGDQTLAELEGLDGVPTWHADVQPIMRDYCQTCHRVVPVAGAPYPLVTLEEVRQHADRVRVRSVQLGDMPPGSALPDALRATLDAWIAGGMPEGTPKLDASPMPDAAVDARVPDAAADARVATDAGSVDATPPAPTWNDDIGPLLRRATCTEGGCHDANGLSARLSLTTYAGFLAGGASGRVLHGDGDPRAAYLVVRMRGSDGAAVMPLGRAARPEAELSLIEAWIAAGYPEE